MKIKVLPTVIALMFGQMALGQQINQVINDQSTKFHFLGDGGADAMQFKSLSAQGGLSLCATPHPRVSGYLSLNFGGSVVKNEKSDSVLISSLYFPDIASSAGAFSLEYDFRHWGKKFIPPVDTDDANIDNGRNEAASEGHSSEAKKKWQEKLKAKLNSFTLDKNKTYSQFLLAVDGSVQQRSIAHDSSVYNLSVTNGDLGLKYRWCYQANDKGKNVVIFTAGAFYESIFLNKDTQDNFNTLITKDYYKNPNDFPKTLQGLSFLAQVQFNSAIIYFRAFDDLKVSRDLAFSVGIKATGNIFSF